MSRIDRPNLAPEQRRFASLGAVSRRGAAVAVVAVIAGLLAGTSPAFALRQRVLAHVEADASTTGPRLPASFLGMSFEYTSLKPMFGTPLVTGLFWKFVTPSSTLAYSP